MVMKILTILLVIFVVTFFISFFTNIVFCKKKIKAEDTINEEALEESSEELNIEKDDKNKEEA